MPLRLRLVLAPPKQCLIGLEVAPSEGGCVRLVCKVKSCLIYWLIAAWRRSRLDFVGRESSWN